MSLVLIAGDCATSTTLALAAAWPSDSDVLVIEADPRGGSMAAWLDVPVSPSLSTVVTRAHHDGWPSIDALSRVTPSGVRLIPAPPRSVEAARAVAEAGTCVFPVLADIDRPVVLIDAGCPSAASGAHAAMPHADVVVVVHRQAHQSARAAAVRLERTAEQVEMIDALGLTMVLAVIGDEPFEPAEVAEFLRDEGGERYEMSQVIRLPEDPLTAAALAGRTGVSSRRLARLPLMRAAVSGAAMVERTVDDRRVRRAVER